jgi:excisionase family DNA binding protein
MAESTVCSFDELPLTLTVSHLQRILGVSKDTAYQIANSRNFPAIRAGRKILIPKPALMAWMGDRSAKANEAI